LEDLSVAVTAGPWWQGLSRLQRRRLSLVAVVVVQLFILLAVANTVLSLDVVEDRREVVGGVETIHFRRELVGDIPLLVLVVVGMALPMAARHLIARASKHSLPG
jgi:hypothetical protein